MGVDVRCRTSGQPGHFAGVGRQDQVSLRMGQLPGLQQIGGGVQAVGVQHGAARKAGQERPRQHPGLGGAGCALDRVTKAGAQQQDRRLLALDAGDIFGGDAARRARFAGAEAALRQTGRHRRQHRFDAGQRDDARPGAQGPFHGQGRSAPVACAARHGQHRTEGALVAVGGALGERIPNHIGRRCNHTLSPLFCRACPLRHCLRNATSPKGRGFKLPL